MRTPDVRAARHAERVSGDKATKVKRGASAWFLFDDDGTLKLSLNSTRQKVKNLQAHPECTFFILDTANPYRTLEVRARAEITPDPDYAFAKKLGAEAGTFGP